MKHKNYKPIIFICAIIFLSLIRFTEGYEVFTYDDPDDLSVLWRSSSFNDGKIILTFIKLINETCAEPTFYYRIIHLNGTIVPITIKISDIEEFNFCVSIYQDLYIGTHIINSNHLFLISYIENQQIGNVTYYQRVGNLIDLHGHVINKMNLTEPLDFPSKTAVAKNINPEEGFIVTSIISLENRQEWITYKTP